MRQYSYDANGNQTAVQNTKTGQMESYTYDAENRLSQVSVTKDGKIAVVQSNRYNGDGQRIQKTEGDQITNYYYQDGVVSYTADGSGAQTSQNLIGENGSIIARQRYAGDSTRYYLYDKDIQGSTTSLIKEDGSADVMYQYTDFGETTVSGDDQAGNEVCYTGGIYDQSTGLYYLNARYYDPGDGRFVTEDSYRGEMDDPDSQNLYAYCAGNPVNYVDPSGHSRYKVFGMPPANQTKYRKWNCFKIDVADIRKTGEKLKAWGARITNIAAIAACASAKNGRPEATLVGVYIGGAGAVVNLAGDYMASSVKKFKKMCKFKMTTYFRWKNKRKTDYTYYMRIKSHVVYYGKKNKKISRDSCLEYSRNAKDY